MTNYVFSLPVTDTIMKSVFFVNIPCSSRTTNAMITRPKPDFKFTAFKDIVNQDEVTLVIEDGVDGIEYMNQFPTMMQILDKILRLSTGVVLRLNG